MTIDRNSPTSGGSELGGQSSVAVLWHNALSMMGVLLISLSLVLLSTFAFFSVVSPTANPYVDVIGYLVLPGMLVVGLLIVPAGIALKYWRVKRRDPNRAVTLRMRIDLQNPRHLRNILAFSGLTFFVMLPVLGVSSYHGYHYTESTDFCANVCHAVMEPQATAYSASAHARVTCAECHIGSGADWFVKSKLSGTRQVLAVWRDSFSRPIPPAITELRPARETCEQCHWPEKFYGLQLKTIVHYSSDEHNTRRDVRMLLRTGGADESIGRVEGIHMHMALVGRVEYVATDPELQHVPWVRYVQRDGRETIYRSDGLLGTAPKPQGFSRTVDCMDCHNRAAHNFRSPQEAVNLLLHAGKINPTLPYIKREAVAALELPYPDSITAHVAIRQSLEQFYRRSFPQLWSARADEIRAAADAVIDLYERNFFPAMKVSWRSYPNNIGHLHSPGCLRCHDGLHVSDEGIRISSDCRTCHLFLNPVPGAEHATVEGDFHHSMSLAAHPSLRCEQCHTGGTLPDCRSCHESGVWLEQAGKSSVSKSTSR